MYRVKCKPHFSNFQVTTKQKDLNSGCCSNEVMAVFKHSFTLEVGKLRIDKDGLDVVLDPGLRLPFVRTTFLGAAASPEERAMCTGGIAANYDASTPGVVEMAGGVTFQERPGYNGSNVIIPTYKFLPDGANIGRAHGRLLFSEQLPLDVNYIH